MYALECALIALWSRIGIKPGTVIGMGASEITAAYAAGMFSLEDGLRLVMQYSALQEAFFNEKEDKGAFENLKEVLTNIDFLQPDTSMISGCTGHLVKTSDLRNPAYWSRQIRESAAWETSAEALAKRDVNLIIEISSNTMMGNKIAAAWPRSVAEGAYGQTGSPVVLASLGETPGDRDVRKMTFIATAAKAYEAGAGVNFSRLFAEENRRRISVPCYPFQKKPFWF